jgi:hypothetical protein
MSDAQVMEILKLRAEITLLRADIARQITITTEQANEIEQLRAFAQFIIDGYPRIDINHEEYRVQAYMAALRASGQPAIEETTMADIRDSWDEFMGRTGTVPPQSEKNHERN